MSTFTTKSADLMRHCLLAAVVGALCASGAHAAPAEADLQSIEKTLNDVGHRIQRLQDMNEVTIVQHTYGYFVDKAQWRSLADLWTQNGTLEIGGRGVHMGKSQQKSMACEAPAGQCR